MRKKFLSLLLATSLVCTMAVGCGSNNNSSGSGTQTEAPDNDSEPTETPDDTSTEETDKPDDSKSDGAGEFAKADGPIIYWSMWDSGSPQAVAIQEAIDAYSAASGNEVTVDWKGRDINTLIGASIDAGEAIDIYEDDYQRLSTTFSTYALSLDDMAETAGYSAKSNDALTSAVKGWAGSLVAIPYQPYASGVFYNKAMFEKAGIESEPTTWAEFLDVCKKLKDSGVTPLTLDGSYVTLNLGYHLARYIGQDGVTEVVTNGDWAENESVLKMAQDIETLVSSGYLSEYAPANWPEGENELGYEETAMVVNASWVPQEITNNTECDLDWGMFSYPAVDGGVDGTEGMMVGAQGMSINKDSKNAQAAFDLIMFITTGEYDSKISLTTNSIPADPNNSEWPEIIQNCRTAFDQFTKAYNWACGMEDNADFTPTITEWGTKLFNGKCTAQEFVDGLEKASK